MPWNKVMGEFAKGTLHSGKGGPVVKKRKQAVAILLSEKRAAGLPVPLPRGKPKRLTGQAKKSR